MCELQSKYYTDVSTDSLETDRAPCGIRGSHFGIHCFNHSVGSLVSSKSDREGSHAGECDQIHHYRQ
jgi:hypothetical protein